MLAKYVERLLRVASWGNLPVPPDPLHWSAARTGATRRATILGVSVDVRDHSPSRDRGGDRGLPVREVRHRRGRRGPRERGRPHDRRAVRHARGDQLHGDARARPHLPLPDSGALRRARAATDDRAQRDAARNRVHGLDRGARGRLHRHLRRRPRAHDPGRDRPGSTPHDLVQPGHVFPLRAKPGGVLQRAGQTEASVDLARLAGLNPAGVVCEIMNEDGTMARVPDLAAFAERHGLKMITVADLIEYRRRTEKLVERVVSVRLPTEHGEFQAIAYRELLDEQAPRRAREGRRRGRRERARPRPLRVPHRRRLPLAALRLRRAARAVARADRGARAAACSCTWRRRAAASAS